MRDIPKQKESWGFVHVDPIPDHSGVSYDDLGFLWTNGDMAPRFQRPDQTSSGAIVFWTPQGLGVWVHTESLSRLPSLSRTEMRQDQWIPIAVAAAELPPFVTE